MKKLRILLVDDHELVRKGLRTVIESQPELRVVGEAADGKEVLPKACELRPDVVVMDLSMPGMHGLQATQLLKAAHPEIKIIVLTGHADETYLTQLCRAGAEGYVLKSSAGDEVVKAIHVVASGGVYFEPSLAGKALSHQIAGAAVGKAGRGGDLSEREKEVLTSLAWGYSNKEIAAKLDLSVKTVETYKVRIAEKLHCRSRTEMVHYALHQGWLNDETGPLSTGKH